MSALRFSSTLAPSWATPAARASSGTRTADARATADPGLLYYGSTPFSLVGPELLADLAKPLAEVRASAAY